jgi:hypothetical protein
VNVQHNCSQHNCGTADTREVYQEREKTDQTRPAVSHVSPQDVVLNTAQMRDAIHVQKFRQNSGTLDADTIITESAARELTAQRALQKASAASVVPKMPARSRNVGQPRRIEALRDAPRASTPQR